MIVFFFSCRTMRKFLYSIFLLFALYACNEQGASGDSDDSYMGPDSISPIDVTVGRDVDGGKETGYTNSGSTVRSNSESFTDVAADGDVDGGKETGYTNSRSTARPNTESFTDVTVADDIDDEKDVVYTDSGSAVEREVKKENDKTIAVPQYDNQEDDIVETETDETEDVKAKEKKSRQSSFAVNRHDTLPETHMSKARKLSTLSLISYNRRLQRLNSSPVRSLTPASRLHFDSPYGKSTRRYNPYIVFKTNVPAYVGLIANIGVEVPFAQYFSFEFPFYYSPYTVTSNWRYRILAAQPEFRYWLKKGMTGHFFGIHGVAGWFNLSVDEGVRYQSTSGNTPIYGGGISYGYALCFHDNWAVEFTAGVGYMHIDYDMFYNIPNGAKFDTRSIHYWGPTKFGINLVYRLK